MWVRKSESEVLFGDPRKPSIRILERVVGLPGEKVQLRDGDLYIDDQRISEDYVSDDHNLKNSSTEEFTVPADSYFVLGDNRDEAFDSRMFGAIPTKLVYAKFWARYWPPRTR
jgi:signal peptidase I